MPACPHAFPHAHPHKTHNVCVFFLHDVYFGFVFIFILFYFTYLFTVTHLSLCLFLFVFCFIPAHWVLQGRRSDLLRTHSIYREHILLCVQGRGSYQAVYTCIRASNLHLLATCFVPVIFSCPYSFDPHLLGLKNAPRDYQGVCDWWWRLLFVLSETKTRWGSLLSGLFSEAILTAMFAALVYVRGGFC